MKPLSSNPLPARLYPAEPPTGAPTLYELAATLWRRRGLFAAVCVLTIGASLIAAFLLPERYTSEATLKVGRVLKNTTDGTLIADVNELGVELQARFGRGAVPDGAPVLDQAAVPKQERRSMDAFLTLRVRAATADEAQQHLRSILVDVQARHDELFKANLAQISRRKQELEVDLGEFRGQIGDIEARLNALRSGELAQAPLLLIERSNLAQKVRENERQLPELGYAEQWSRPTTLVVGPSRPKAPAEPRRAVIIGFGLVAGLFAGLFAALAADFLRNFRVRLYRQESLS